MKIISKSTGRRSGGRGILGQTLLHTGSFILAMALSGAQLLGGAAPLGLAYLAAVAGGRACVTAFAGAVTGYLLSGGGLKYCAAALLTAAGGFLLKDLFPKGRRVFLPALAAGVTALIGAVYVGSQGWEREALAALVLEATLIFAGGYFFRIGISPQGHSPSRQLVSLIILMAGIVVALTGLELPAKISAGRLFALLALLTVCWRTGPLWGCAAGLVLGFGADMALWGELWYAPVYGICGLVSGLFVRRGRLSFVVAVIIVNTVAVLLRANYITGISGLYEVFAATVIFFACPRSFIERLPLKLREGDEAETTEKTPAIRDAAARRLGETSQAYQSLNESLKDIFTVKPQDNSAQTVFSGAVEKVCRKCSQKSSCWHREDWVNKEVWSGLRTTLESGSKLTPASFPPHFSSRCHRIRPLSEEINARYAQWIDNKRSQVRLQASQELLCRQYGEIARQLDEVSLELGREPKWFPKMEAQICAELIGEYPEMSVGVWCYEDGRYQARLEGVPGLDGTEAAKLLTECMGVAMEYSGEQEGALEFHRREPIRIIAGSAAAPKAGEKVSGDCAMYFKTPQGILYIILSDGMGSGEDARRESRAVTSLLEKFLRAGVQAQAALRILNGALSIRAAGGGAFATVDMLCIDLYTGKTALYKLGAAPTYIKRGAKVSRISSPALPPGLAAGSAAADVTRLTLGSGDIAVLSSDGLADKNCDSELMRSISEYSGTSPRTLAVSLLETARRSDDITVFVIRVEDNK